MGPPGSVTGGLFVFPDPWYNGVMLDNREHSKLLNFAGACVVAGTGDQRVLDRLYHASLQSPIPPSPELLAEMDTIREFMRHPRAFGALVWNVENNLSHELWKQRDRGDG